LGDGSVDGIFHLCTIRSRRGCDLGRSGHTGHQKLVQVNIEALLEEVRAGANWQEGMPPHIFRHLIWSDIYDTIKQLQRELEDERKAHHYWHLEACKS
jgi:hypothetical protein